jgi:hypothetical protein
MSDAYGRPGDQPARPLPDRLARCLHDIRAASWFAALGEPLTQAERWEAQAYLAALGMRNFGIAAIADWAEAARTAQSPAWSHEWWDREEQERQRLLALAGASADQNKVLSELSEATEAASALVHGAAAIAAARASVADQSLIRVAAGAATQASYQAALAELALGKDAAEHAFIIKFRLYQAGRWPLGIVGDRFYLF